MNADVPSTAAAGPGDAHTDDVRVVGGKYRIGRVLGEGGFGVVYEAENTWTGRRVALKMLATERVADPVQVQRFMREARTAASLRHPNVVDVLDMGQDPADGTLYIVQELLVGEDLRALLERERKVDVARARSIVTEALRGLAAAHAAGVVHRDLKPANIFLARDADGRAVPKLIDFGIARGASTDPRAPLTVAPLGTPAYMSPEQLRADAPVGPASDVWSIGVVLYQLLAGEHPFPTRNRSELVVAVLSGRAPSFDALAHAPRALRDVARRALAFAPEDRFSSAAEMLAALTAPPPARGRAVVAGGLVVATLLAGAAAYTAREAPHPPRATPPAPAPTATVAPPPAPSAVAVDAAVLAAPGVIVARPRSRRAREVAPSVAVAPSVTAAPRVVAPQTPRARAGLLTPGGGYPSP